MASNHNLDGCQVEEDYGWKDLEDRSIATLQAHAEELGYDGFTINTGADPDDNEHNAVFYKKCGAASGQQMTLEALTQQEGYETHFRDWHSC